MMEDTDPESSDRAVEPREALENETGIPETISTFPPKDSDDPDLEDATLTTATSASASLSTTHRENARARKHRRSSSPNASTPRRSRSSCWLLPHGSYALVVAVVCTAAWVASVFQDGCDFARVEGPIVAELIKAQRAASSSNPNDQNQPIPPWLEFGINAYREPLLNLNPEDNSYAYVTNFEQACYFYPLDESSEDDADGTPVAAASSYTASSTLFDAAWTTARAFSFLALVLGGGGTLFVWCSTCFVFARGTWRWTGYELLLASLCQGIALGCWFTTQVCAWNDCALFWGSKADVVSSALWALGGLLIVCRYPTPHTHHHRLRRREEEEEEEEDGYDHDRDHHDDHDHEHNYHEEDHEAYGSDGWDDYPEDGDDELEIDRDHGNYSDNDDDDQHPRGDGVFVIDGSQGGRRRHRGRRFRRRSRNDDDDEDLGWKPPPGSAELA